MRTRPGFWTVFVAALLSSAAVQSQDDVPADVVDYVGTFSQFRETGEHVYGYQLELWRDGDEMVGLWSRADGRPADFPTVSITGVRWNRSTGSLRFTVRWCGETATFRGILKGREIAGEVVARGARTKVRLRRSDFEQAPVRRAEWKSRVDQVLKRLGPRCR